jgi:DNA-binding CsgD family transcriptional regulator
MRAWPLAGRSAELARLVASLRAPGHRTVVVAGEAGVGKSRLAAEAAARVEASHTVLRIQATEASRGLPLGAMAPCLPAQAPQVNLLGWAAGSIVDRSAGKPMVLVVDDAHWLDPASAALVHHLSRQITVLAAVRAGAGCPDAVTALWRDDTGERLDLGPFDLEGTAAVVRAALDGAVAAVLVDRLHSLSQGNVLFLTELVTAAVRRDPGQRWRFYPELVPGSRLIDLVRRRTGDLKAGTRDTLELVALGEPLTLCQLTALAGSAAIEEAEAHGLIRLEPEDGDRIRLAHPLFGEVARAMMPRLRMRRHYRELAEAVEVDGSRRREDTVRAALWRLESGTATDPAPLLAACRLAWATHDYPLALRLGEGAAECGGGVDAAILMATVLNYTERPYDAEAVLARVWNDSCDDRQRAELTLSRAWNLGFGLGRVAEAEQLIRSTRREVTDPSRRQDLTVLLMQMVGSRGDVPTALKLSAALLAAPATPAIKAQALSINALGSIVEGRYDDSVAACRCALDDQDSWLEAVPVLVVSLHLYWWMAALARGDLPGAGRAVDSLTAALPESASWDRATETATLLHAHLQLTQGHARQAASALQELATAHMRGSPSATGMTPHCLAVYAQARALLADHHSAEEAAAAATRAATRPAALGYRPWLETTLPWIAVASGRLTHAVDLAIQAAISCRETGFRNGDCPYFETIALHTLVRLGAADSVVERLSELADSQDGPFARLCADHADAATRCDGPALEQVSLRFEALQLTLNAAEAAAQAARAHADAGRRSSARAAAARAWALAARCKGVSTPALARLRAPGLTPREYEIASLACSDLTNKQIAQHLVISERTVENHLRSAYHKLGARNRAELKPLITDQPHGSA